MHTRIRERIPVRGTIRFAAGDVKPPEQGGNMLNGLLAGTGVSFAILLVWFFAVDDKATLAHQRRNFRLAVMLRVSGVIVGTASGVVVAWLLGGIWAGLMTIATSLVCAVVAFYAAVRLNATRKWLARH